MAEKMEESSIREALSDLSFEELQQLKQKIGTKVYNEAMFGKYNEESIEKNFKRMNKNRPRELSSKRPVSTFRDVFDIKKKFNRDPRFDDLSGDYDDRVFEQSYSFLNGIKLKEKKELKRELKRETNSGKKEKIKILLDRITNQEREQKKKAEAIEEKQRRRKEIIDNLKEGKKPYFLKKSEEKKLALLKRYKELKKSGKLEKYVQKKRKRNAAKDSKLLHKRCTEPAI